MRRRQETIEEILAIAEDVMTEEGVNGLSLSEVARRLGVKPPSRALLSGPKPKTEQRMMGKRAQPRKYRRRR